jgi:hypothetical protein
MTLPALRPEVSAIVASQIANLEQIAEAIRATDNLGDLTEARARIEAVRAWAKVHQEVKAIRLQLLVVEVEALVRIVELGGAEQLPSRTDREVAEWLAKLSVVERADLIAKSGAATTASWMVRSVWRQQAEKAEKAERKRAGMEMASRPPLPDAYDEEAITAARHRVTNLSAVIAEIAEEYMGGGRSFTVDELADEIISGSAITREMAEDDSFREGVKEVSRRIIRTTAPLSVEGIPIPRIITVRIGGKYQRIPVANATLAHLDADIASREEQIQHDQAKLQKMMDVRDKLSGMLTAEDDAATTRIGTIISRIVCAR